MFHPEVYFYTWMTRLERIVRECLDGSKIVGVDMIRKRLVLNCAKLKETMLCLIGNLKITEFKFVSHLY